MLAEYVINNSFAVYRNRISFHAWSDEAYPPGGFLRVMRDVQGRALAGPLVSEIVSWKILDGIEGNENV
jgi:hypothetical protein